MKVLIIGGAGYVGTSLIPQCLDRGWEVTVLDNLMFGGDPLLPFFRNPRFRFIEGDVRRVDDIQGPISKADVVIHLAAIVGYPACRKDPRLAEDVNVMGTQNVVKCVGKEQYVLFGSTGSNYGAVEEICTEETPLNPLSLYGQTKTIAERQLMENCQTTAFRFATAFGVSPRLRLDLLVNDFVHKAMTQRYLVVYEKHFMRTFIHVHDMGRAFVFAIEHRDQMVGQIYNVGADKMNYSKEQICQMIQEEIDSYVHYADVGKDADARNYVVSYEKLGRLGYATSINVSEGIRELKRALTAVNPKMPYTNV